MTEQELIALGLTPEQAAAVLAQDQRFADGIHGSTGNDPEKAVWLKDANGETIRSTKLSDFVAAAVAANMDPQPIINAFQALNRNKLPEPKRITLDALRVVETETPIAAMFSQQGRYEAGDPVRVIRIHTTKGVFLDSIPCIVNDPSLLKEKVADYGDGPRPAFMSWKGRGPIEQGDDVIVKQFVPGFQLSTDVDNADRETNGVLQWCITGGLASRVTTMEYNIEGSAKSVAKAKNRAILAGLAERTATAGIE